MRLDDATGTRVGAPLTVSAAYMAHMAGSPLWVETMQRVFEKPVHPENLSWMFENGRENYGTTWRLWDHAPDVIECKTAGWRRTE